MGGAGCEWAKMLPEVQRLLNNSETKVTGRTPFEMLHGYRPRFEQGALLALSATRDDWTPPEELQTLIRGNMEMENTRRKAVYDKHRHDKIHYSMGEIVVMRRAPKSTGESTKLQDKYRGPLVVTEVLSSDVYRVTELNATRGSRFATTAHVSQLKSWRLPTDDEDEGVQDGTITELFDVEGPSLLEVQPPETPATPDIAVPDDDRRPQRVVRKPNWLRDYSW